MGRLTPEVLQYIENNCFEKLTLKEHAHKCFYNPSYFSQVFRECFGKSLTEFIIDKRLSEAQHLLSETGMSVEQVCIKVGYHDRKQFYKHFKERTGTTPRIYRERSRFK